MEKEVTKFIYELGQLRRLRHVGLTIAGVTDPLSVADHNLRAAQIAYILAFLEGYKNPSEICSMVVFHDIDECRIGDIHKVANRYIKADKEGAVKDQTKDLGGLGESIFKLYNSVGYNKNIAGDLAKDADYLEQAFTAKEYLEKGYKFAQDWIDNVGKVLKTETARKLWHEMQKTDSNDWWQGVKKIPGINE
ncbi:MAG: Metal dependent phosphohydrolase [candidate division CPR2 bacterium GW2011_GWC1_39_9]|uniref:Metal dependent phosphohydrolase n=1 Tax=candidate division CPR2 bacterium GW2011_GWC2_39_10 TaxID=1618345 RepID=A0A0G0P9V9_UNCC2|nr:MAG: Metal dependent phosphohydrolase [candidate division CPR2 bacterium GW2011_GWC2_39_10]KKR36032.1 MAG: Metal dependent phosphohydrolase [candidate division CPR2 bacterium GW2011_GWC1_39_9]